MRGTRVLGEEEGALVRKLFGIVALVAAVAAPGLFAQDYPNKSVRLIVPFPPGGANDVIGRLLGAGLSESMGKPFVIDNRGGANSIIGCDLTAKAAPDGYTILIVPASHAINPSLYDKLPYDSIHDFTPLSLIGNGAYVLVANAQFPAHTAAELISLAKAKEVRFASAGVGNTTHLAGELFALLAGIHMLHVPYKGGGPAVTDLIAGRVSIYFSTVALATPHMRGGRLKGIGVTTAKRVSSLPQVPTIAESGLPGYEVNGWYGLLAPARTPVPIVNRLNSEIRKALQNPEMREKLAALGVEAIGSTPAEFEKIIETDITKWTPVIKRLNIKMD